jgi:hypothetical protein
MFQTCCLAAVAGHGLGSSRAHLHAYSDHVSNQKEEDAADRLEPHLAAAVVDVFVYVVVLNLFVEYLPQVLSETFTLSLLTAVLLKGVLEIVVAAKNRVKARFREASTPTGKVVAAVLLWVVLFGSKFLVLEAVALVFGDRVSLGGFFSVTLLILALLLSRAAIRRLLQRPHRRAVGQG